jgi:hypothetical protein
MVFNIQQFQQIPIIYLFITRPFMNFVLKISCRYGKLIWVAGKSYFNSLRTTHFLFSGKKSKEPLRGKKGKENESRVKERGPEF